MKLQSVKEFRTSSEQLRQLHQLSSYDNYPAGHRWKWFEILHHASRYETMQELRDNYPALYAASYRHKLNGHLIKWFMKRAVMAG